MHKPRDEIRGDLLDGRATLSAKADAFALKVSRLLSDAEADRKSTRLNSSHT